MARRRSGVRFSRHEGYAHREKGLPDPHGGGDRPREREGPAKEEEEGVEVGVARTPAPDTRAVDVPADGGAVVAGEIDVDPRFGEHAPVGRQEKVPLQDEGENDGVEVAEVPVDEVEPAVAP